jgi:glycogen phosphorylase
MKIEQEQNKKADHTGPGGATLAARLEYHLQYTLAKRHGEGIADDYYKALANSLRPYILEALWATEDRYRAASAKRMYYLSLEFLVGRCLRSNLTNLGLYEDCRAVLEARGIDLADVLEAEPDPALGNGGLGRLAACFLDSLASLGMPGYGYGINYEFGLFKQEIRGGRQYESPDQWFANESPWMVERASDLCLVPVYGRVEQGTDRLGNPNPMWLDWRIIVGVPYDLPIVGRGGNTVNYLRLFSARSSSEFDMTIFNTGDYVRAVQEKISSENISKVLYPSDAAPSGRELRLLQEYFLVACSVRDIMGRFFKEHDRIELFPEKVAIQLNDTHPALTVAELMRILVDEHEIPWAKAWEWTQSVCGYTNHTLMGEALEKWPMGLLEYVIPRHLQVIMEINHRFLEDVRSRWPGDEEKIRRMSLIEEGPDKSVRMANLAIIGSHAVNGVSKLHSQLLVESLVPDFAALWPQRFHNKTNGINHRRWLVEANDGLASLISRRIGDDWISDPSRLQDLAPHSSSEELRSEFFETKRQAKLRLSKLVRERTGIIVNNDSMFDVQVKRIHEYKRQLLNVLSILHGYLALTEDGVIPPLPRTWIFAGKAAPGYYMAKLIVKLINDVSRCIARDPRVKDLLSVVFLPDYKVSMAEKIIPAADLSEQISTAGMEASGTGNMKLAMNGALTIGTLDGANIEIREAVGPENIFIFGLTASQIREHRQNKSYVSMDYYQQNPCIRRVVDFLESKQLCGSEVGVYKPIRHVLLAGGDPYFHFADLESYLQMQSEVVSTYLDRNTWGRKALLNIAGMGYFSSDRSINEYASDTWNIHSFKD